MRRESERDEPCGHGYAITAMGASYTADGHDKRAWAKPEFLLGLAEKVEDRYIVLVRRSTLRMAPLRPSRSDPWPSSFAAAARLAYGRDAPGSSQKCSEDRPLVSVRSCPSCQIENTILKL